MWLVVADKKTEQQEVQDRIHIGNGIFWPRIKLPDSLSQLDGQPTLFIYEPIAQCKINHELVRACIIFDKKMLDTGCTLKMINNSHRTVTMLLGLTKTESIVQDGKLSFEVHPNASPGHFYMTLLDARDGDEVDVQISNENMTRPDHLPPLLMPPTETSQPLPLPQKLKPLKSLKPLKPLKSPNGWWWNTIIFTLLALLLVSAMYVSELWFYVILFTIKPVMRFIEPYVCCMT